MSAHAPARRSSRQGTPRSADARRSGARTPPRSGRGAGAGKRSLGVGLHAPSPAFRDALATITGRSLATEEGARSLHRELLVGSRKGRRGAQLLARHGDTPAALREAFTKVRGSARVTSPGPEGSDQAWRQRRTHRARRKASDPVIGREPRFAGGAVPATTRTTRADREQGVGKTAIVEGSPADRGGDVPESLRGKASSGWTSGRWLPGEVPRRVRERLKAVLGDTALPGRHHVHSEMHPIVPGEGRGRDGPAT